MRSKLKTREWNSRIIQKEELCLRGKGFRDEGWTRKTQVSPPNEVANVREMKVNNVSFRNPFRQRLGNLLRLDLKWKMEGSAEVVPP